MKSTFFNVLVNIVLAFIIIFNAELGSQLGIGDPLQISLVWPATGFSLAALLLFGYQVWPGIFLGNFGYDLYHLLGAGQEIYKTIGVALVVAFGSTLQAVVANYIIRRFCSRNYLVNVRDIFVFLIPGGILSCLIACTIGVAALEYFKPMSLHEMAKNWFTFWTGDTMGVYVFTPLVIAWTLLKPINRISDFKGEVILMTVLYFIVSLTMPYLEYPVRFLNIPLILWIAYRFGMRGATLGVFFVALSILLPTSIGYVFSTGQGNPLFFTIVFLEAIVATSLMIAAIVNEKIIAIEQLEMNQGNMHDSEQQQLEEGISRNSDLMIQDKIASLGKLTSGMIKLVHIPLKRIGVFAKNSLDLLGQIKPDSNSNELKSTIDSIKNYLTTIVKSEAQASTLTKAIEEQSNLTNPQQLQVRTIDLNQLISESVTKATNELQEQFHNFGFKTHLEFDKTITMVIAVPEELANALHHLFYYSMISMKEKKDMMGVNYDPELRIKTLDLENHVEIEIRDNAGGIKGDKKMISSLINSTPTEDSRSLAEEPKALVIALSNDIITHLYQGAIEVNFEQNQYLQLKVILPKNSV